MKGVVFVFLGALTFLDVTWGLTCEAVINKYMQTDFQESDVNGDGVLNLQDRCVTVQYFDADKNNVISMDEVKAGIQKHYPNVLPIAENLFHEISGPDGILSDFDLVNYFSGTDANGDGVATKCESDAFWREVLERLFREANVKPEGCTW